MSKIYFQGTYGAYSHLAALSMDSNAEVVPCKTFDECFVKASKDSNSKIIIPESNRITGNIGIDTEEDFVAIKKIMEYKSQ